ncbi:type II toxin-antitoxin system PemK/MazF family toxin [Candidatus Woesearchaeota archaeon]|nr:type II toxin-antitoxin system PemK/MazF family toxin [Candidatus Woesearchaeota archaeon]
MFKQGDIVLVPFPYSDLTSSKQRPALIISNKYLNKTEDRICCLITSNSSAQGLELTSKCFAEGKLPFQSVVKPQRIFTVNEKIIRKKLATCTIEFHRQVLNLLHEYLKQE